MTHKLSSLFSPPFFSLFSSGYSRKSMLQDLLAGITVGVVSIPLSLAFAIASGVRPEQGIFTAIVAGILVALFGGSKYQISGPTGAFVILIYSIVTQFGYSGLVIATFIAGLILIAMGLSRVGALIKFIPYPVTIGFTSGLALFIFISQIPDLLGFHLEVTPKNFFFKLLSIGQHLPSSSLYALVLSVITIAIIAFWPKLVKGLPIPGSLIAILVTSALVYFFHFPVETIRDRFGAISDFLPQFTLPSLDFSAIPQLIPPAIAIALLAGIESLLSAVVADGMTGTKHNSNTELIGQGIANIGSIFFGGIPATGAIARTATGIKNGAKSPVAALASSLSIGLILLLFGSLIAIIPMATLGGILAVVAYNMSEWRHFAKLFRSPKGDIAVLLVTFLLTVFVDLVTAIEVGIILATLFFVDKISKTSHSRFLKESHKRGELHKEDAHLQIIQQLPEEIEVFEISGALFFAAVESFNMALSEIRRKPKILILRMRHLATIDATGIRALEDVLDKSRREGCSLILSGLSAEVEKILQESGFLERLDANSYFPIFDAALQRARELYDALPKKESVKGNG